MAISDHDIGPQTDIYRTALDTIAIPVVIYDDVKVLYANAAACRVLGGGVPSQVVGMSVTDFILPDLAEVNNARRAYVIEHGVGLRNVVVKIRGLDGKPNILHVDIQPIPFNGSTVAMATLALA